MPLVAGVELVFLTEESCCVRRVRAHDVYTILDERTAYLEPCIYTDLGYTEPECSVRLYSATPTYAPPAPATGLVMLLNYRRRFTRKFSRFLTILSLYAQPMWNGLSMQNLETPRSGLTTVFGSSSGYLRIVNGLSLGYVSMTLPRLLPQLVL